MTSKSLKSNPDAKAANVAKPYYLQWFSDIQPLSCRHFCEPKPLKKQACTPASYWAAHFHPVSQLFTQSCQIRVAKWSPNGLLFRPEASPISYIFPKGAPMAPKVARGCLKGGKMLAKGTTMECWGPPKQAFWTHSLNGKVTKSTGCYSEIMKDTMEGNRDSLASHGCRRP